MDSLNSTHIIATALSAFLRYWREGLVDFRGGLPAAMTASQ